MPTGPLWRKADVEREISGGTLPPWRASAYAELKAKVLDDAFPCTFGTVAMRKGDVVVGFVERAEPEEVRRQVRAALIAYTDLLRPLSAVAASMMPCAVFVALPAVERSIGEWFADGWALLQWLHEHDTHAWPARVPANPDDPAWSFCFGGVPLFVNFKTPAHERRRSRRMSSASMLLFQARDGFDVVAGDTPQGRRKREIIREKLAAYDAVPIYPELAHYGHPENREWKQYFVPEDNVPVATRCPFHP